ncbi:MAG: deoxyguanosinetriphosphate triphosphohydrolase, partial [Xanthobacteraceae bacterium]
IDDIAAVPLPGRIIHDIRATYPDLDEHRLVHELIRQLIGFLIDDVVAETGRRLAGLGPRSADDVRNAAAPVAGFSADVAEADRAIKAFLKPHMYRHPRVMRVMDEAAGVVSDLFALYTTHPGDLPEEWQQGLAGLDAAARARHIADFIAGMTDRYALAEHGRFFDSTPELR